MIRLLLFFSFFFIISCSKPPINLATCDGLDKLSRDYVKCLEKLIKSSNTASNMKEFGKHKTGASFFKRVIVQPSD